MDTSFTVPVAINDPTFRAISKAIRTYLSHEFANVRLGIDGDPPPLRISAFNGKGPGFYPTSPDGRPEHTPEFQRYMERSEGRMESDPAMTFGYAEVDRAMESLKAERPHWSALLEAVDVAGERLVEYADRVKLEQSTAKRWRKRATFFLYAKLRLIPPYGKNIVNFRLIKVA